MSDSAIPWTAVCQVSLSFIVSWSLLKLISVELVMLYNHHPLLLLPSIFPSIRVFSNELTLHIRWPKYWNFSFSISPSNEYSGLISFRIDWFDLLGSKEIGILQSKGFSRIFSSTTIQKHQLFHTQHFCGPSLTFVHDYWKNHSFDYKDLCWQSDSSVHFFKNRKLVFSNLTKFYRLPSKLL